MGNTMAPMAPGVHIEAPEPLPRLWGLVFAAGAEMPVLKLSECCAEQPASALAGDFCTTLRFAGEGGHSGEDPCPNSQLAKGGIFLFRSVKPK